MFKSMNCIYIARSSIKFSCDPSNSVVMWIWLKILICEIYCDMEQEKESGSRPVIGSAGSSPLHERLQNLGSAGWKSLHDDVLSIL